MTKRGLTDQLMRFRSVINRQAKLQVCAMMSLSNPDQLDDLHHATVADVARVMGHQQKIRKADQKRVFSSKVYDAIEEVGMTLRREPIGFLVREPLPGPSRKRQYQTASLTFSVLQEFGFCYRDEDGEVIDLHRPPDDLKDDLLYYKVNDDGPPIWAIPAFDRCSAQILCPHPAGFIG